MRFAMTFFLKREGSQHANRYRTPNVDRLIVASLHEIGGVVLLNDEETDSVHDEGRHLVASLDETNAAGYWIRPMTGDAGDLPYASRYLVDGTSIDRSPHRVPLPIILPMFRRIGNRG